MNILKSDLDRAAMRVPITPEQTDALWVELQAQSSSMVAGTASSATRRFDAANLAYYLGAFIVLGAMGWFLGTAWEAFGGAVLCGICACYALAFILLGRVLKRHAAPTAAGLLFTLAVGMTPLAVYGLERWLGWWPAEDPGMYSGFHEWVKGGWFLMEVCTIFAGAAMLWFVRFPFLTAPVAFALWYMSMDLTPLIYGSEFYSWENRLHVSLWFGLAMLLTAYLVDVRRGWRGPDYGFWLSLFGVLAFWGGLTMMRSGDEWGKVSYCAINLGLMLAGVLFDRRALVVFGALGVNGYIGHLAYTVFEGSMLFPFALTGVGLLIIGMGVLYQRKRESWRGAVIGRLPESWQRLLPARGMAA